MSRAQHKRGIVERLLGQQRQRLRLDLQHLLAFKADHGNMLLTQQIIVGVIALQRKRILIMEGFI